MNKAYLLMGGNIGDRAAYLYAAAEAVESKCGTVSAQSALYETAAWGKEDQAPFLNMAVEVATSLLPTQLLHTILEIEAALGRQRALQYAPRVIDIDILLFNQDIISLPQLQVPHPHLPVRRFALQPLTEIAAGVVHPVLHKTIARLLAECPDPLHVHKFSA